MPAVQKPTFNKEKTIITDCYSFLSRYLLKGDITILEASTCTSKAREAYAGRKKLCRPLAIYLKLKSRGYCIAVHPVLLYACEVRTLRAEDGRHLRTFGHRCLFSIPSIGWSECVSYTGKESSTGCRLRE